MCWTRRQFSDLICYMFPYEIYIKPIWCLYDDMAGQIMLKHPWGKRIKVVPCPHCGNALVVENYKATCCGKNFKTGFSEFRQVEPVGTHKRASGRGWASLRPYLK
jgi:hypothetical protein